jgi:fumarate hydratase class II
MAAIRIEKDTFGPIEVPSDRLWGAQTQRSLQNFAISGERMPLALLHALATVKKAAALVNQDLGTLDKKLGDAIVRACDEVIAGKHDDEFPLVVWQTGSGTQSNMNMNEVVANRASELLGGPRGEERLVHPNDHVNRGQSSNDVFPAAMALACTDAVRSRVLPAVKALRDVLDTKAKAFGDIVKIGRTHLMDATPLTLGQEISGWVAQLDHGMKHLESAVPHLSELALGGTAVGTGLNAHPEYAVRVAKKVAELSCHPIVTAPNKFESLAAHDAIVFAHGALKTLAASLTKIANDVRWLASGPRSGIGEITIPENEPGSSIMPGKVNPIIPEVVNQIAFEVIGNDVTITMASEGGQLQLNAFEPIIGHSLFKSIEHLKAGCTTLARHCVAGITANRELLAERARTSAGLATALNPYIGYENATRVAREALRTGRAVDEIVLEMGLLDRATLEDILRPDVLTAPRQRG